MAAKRSFWLVVVTLGVAGIVGAAALSFSYAPDTNDDQKTLWQRMALSLYNLEQTGIKVAAGTAIIGKVGIDQTTPGTTNKVSIGTDGTVIANPPAVTANNDATSTAATGTNWTALASHTAKQATIINTTATAISVRYATGTGISLPDGTGYTFRGISNTNGLQIKRTDDSNTQVSVAYNYENW